MNSRNIRLIGVSFYDGPLEGFAKGIIGQSAYYFKVVAWDRDQDRRLYLLAKIADAVYQNLIDLLDKTGQLCDGDVCIPNWIFSDSEMQMMGDKIIEIGVASLGDSEILVLGDSLLGALEVMKPNASQLASAKAFTCENFPGDLEKWLALGTQESLKRTTE